MLHHVFEHMDNQQEILEHASKILTPGGKILIRIPNVDSYAYRKYKGAWYGMQAPVHLSLPSQKGMNYLLKKAGLKTQMLKGENVLEFWAHSEAYALDIWDYDENGIRTYIKNHSLKMRRTPPLFTKKKMKEFRQLNRQVKKIPSLCDWVSYHILKDPSSLKVIKKSSPIKMPKRRKLVSST